MLSTLCLKCVQQLSAQATEFCRDFLQVEAVTT